MIKLVDVLTHPCRTFDGVELHLGKASIDGLAFELVGVVEIRRGEELWPPNNVGVAMLSIDNVPLDDHTEHRVAKQVPFEPLEQRCIPGDPDADHNPAGPSRTNGPPECRRSLPGVSQVVERTEHQHGIVVFAKRSELTSVTDVGINTVCEPCVNCQFVSPFHLPGNGIHQDHLITALRQRQGVGARGSANVEHPRVGPAGPAQEVLAFGRTQGVDDRR